MDEAISTVVVETCDGPQHFRYNICTPLNPEAKSIDPALPTIFFIHSELWGSECWQNQFRSSLRRFNLVSFDLRSHGMSVARVPTGYSRNEAAAETAQLMETLHLPQCHIVGSSMGADIGLQIALDFPEKVLSLTLIAPLAEVEDQTVASARQEIVDCWVNRDEEMAMLAVTGGLQLVNNITNPLIKSFIALQTPRSLRNWNEETRETFENVSVKYFQMNRRRDPSVFKTLKCPILIINCMEDVAACYAPELFRQLKDNGVQAELVNVEDAPHLGYMTHPRPINDAIEDFVTSLCSSGIAPPVPEAIVSPWESSLRRFGWKPESDTSDTDSSDEFV